MATTKVAAPHTVIIGGGLAGLAAAWYLQQQGVSYTLLEASARLGGLVRTETMDGFTIEYGPDAFITRKPWAYELACEIGLAEHIIPISDTPERIYILNGKRLDPLPEGLHLLVPTRLGPFLRSRLLSWPGKIRLLLDYIIPAQNDSRDESLAQFVRRRMGREALEMLADPLLAGVYNADMERQSILATFPQYRQLEQHYGGLIRGMRAADAEGGRAALPAMMSLRGGMQQLVDVLAARLSGEIRCGAPVSRIELDGVGCRLTLASSESLEADSLIVATSALSAAALLHQAAPNAAAMLREIRYAGIGSMSLAYPLASVPRKLDAYGVVIPSREGRRIDGMQWSSVKWRGRAPQGMALIRVFFGGPHTRDMLDKDEDALAQIVSGELRDILGITAKPLFVRTGIWRDAYPQYDVGHNERVADIEAALPDGIRLAGNAYHGVGLPDTVRTARQAAQALAKARSINEQSGVDR